MARLLALIALLAAALASLAAPAVADPHLVRVVLVERHGVRPPIASNDALAKYAQDPWPAWSAKAGELTPHGGATVFAVGATVARVYHAAGVLPAGCAPAALVSVWADNADERTRDSGRAFLTALEPGCDVDAHWSDSQARDPIFNGSDQPACAIDADKAAAAIQAITDDPLVFAPLDGALAQLQAILGPHACSGGAGTCFGETTPTPGPPGAAPVYPVTSSLAEDLLLEYVDNMPMGDVGWGRATRADIVEVMKIHEHLFGLVKDNVYASARRGAPMARVVMAALAGQPVGGGPTSGPDTRVLVLAGHDTNLAWMASIFGLQWTFPDNPDFTAPSTALAFELWRDGGRDYVRPVVYYLGLDQLRTLQPADAEAMPLAFAGCENGPMQTCPLEDLRTRMDAVVPADCGVL
jgi:4-phytase/acid phosphatase